MSEIKDYVNAINFNELEKLSCYNLSLQLYQDLTKDLSVYHGSAWQDQTLRAMLSVSLNIAEGVGRGRGYCSNHLLMARGSLYEALTAIKASPLADKYLDRFKAILDALDAFILWFDEKYGKK